MRSTLFAKEPLLRSCLPIAFPARLRRRLPRPDVRNGLVLLLRISAHPRRPPDPLPRPFLLVLSSATATPSRHPRSRGAESPRWPRPASSAVLEATAGCRPVAAPFVIVIAKPPAVHGCVCSNPTAKLGSYTDILWRLQFAVVFRSFSSIRTVEGMMSP
jgi:hypothetical protein